MSVRKISSGLAAVVALSSLTVAVVGCGGEPEPAKLCVPNEQRSCVCSSGETGYQKCSSSGMKYLSCRCDTSDTSTDQNGSCLPAGSACGGSVSCCGGSICVDYQGYGTYCGALCSSGSDCDSGCCSQTTDGAYNICAPCY